VVPAEGMLSVELMKAMDDWLLHSDMMGNKPKLGIGCLDNFAMDRAKGRMESIGYEVKTIAFCGSLLWLMIVVRAAWSLAPFFFGLEEDGAIFCAMVGFTAVVHTIWRLESVWALAAIAASAWRATSLVVLI
jgi:hypothetical protein